jgi:protein-S-isoprenylcysteine O-methyltransferase Ste14/endonuclease/exonuclease/phosphatase family metal-dependent hydrolase
MSDGQQFRLILLVAVVVLLPIGIYHRLKSRTGEKLDRRQEGLFILIALRLVGIIGWIALFAYLVNPSSMAWASLPIPTSFRWLGIGLLVVTGVLFTWTFRNLGKNLTDTVVTRENHTLVTTGPYRWVRHPFYTSAAVAAIAVSLVAANGFLFVIGSVGFILLAIRTPIEERHLIARFGNEYRSYMQRSGRFVPRLFEPVVLICGFAVLFAAVQLLITRLFSDRNAVSLRTLQIQATNLVTAFDGRLKLASFNIAHGRGTNESNWSDPSERQTRLRRIAELLRSEKVDIAVLNEVDFASLWSGHENQAEFIAREAGFRHVMEQRNFDMAFPFVRLRFGNAVLSRFPITSSQFVPLPALSNRERRLAGSKHGSVADIQLDETSSIRVFAVHLEWRDEATRSRSAEVIASCATNSPYPFFCLGDFNCFPAAFAGNEFRLNGPTAVDKLLQQTGLRIAPISESATERSTFPSFAPIVTIDWILIPSGWSFTRHSVLDVRLSDHRPVFAEVQRVRHKEL